MEIREQALWRDWRVGGTRGRRENRGESAERSRGARSQVSGSLDFTLRAVESLHGFEAGRRKHSLGQPGSSGQFSG